MPSIEHFGIHTNKYPSDGEGNSVQALGLENPI